MAIWFISGFFILLSIVIAYYYFIKRSNKIENDQENIIHLQTDGFDFILYKGNVTEISTDYQRFLGNLDIVIYSKSLFIGFLEPKQTYLNLPGKAIQSIKYEPNKVTISCFKELTGIKKIVLKGKSTKQLYLISKKISFISRRSKKASVV